MSLSGLELIKSYRAEPGRYLPMVDRTAQIPSRNEYGEVNIGWNAGLLGDNRPYFVECWAVDQITMLTIFVSTKGIEDISPEDLEQLFLDLGYFSYRDKEHYSAEVKTFNNPAGDEFYSINITVGIEDESGLIDGAPILSWSILNEYNKKTMG